MQTATQTPQEVVQRGREIYEQQLKPQVETGNYGKFLVINTETEEYEMDADDVAAAKRAKARFAGAPLFSMRVGHAAAYRLGSRRSNAVQWQRRNGSMPTIALPDVTAPIQALTAWLAQSTTKERIQIAVSEALAGAEQYVLSNTSLRVPRQPIERQNGFRPWLDAFAAHGFDHWLNSYKRQLAQDIQSEMLLEFREDFAGLRNQDLIRETVETLLWPEMEPLLRNRAEEFRSYAVASSVMLGCLRYRRIAPRMRLALAA